jgi:hypothetical protein
MTERTVPHSEVIKRAAMWLADRKGDEFGTIIAVVKERFGLSAVEAAQACTLANKFRLNRRAFG